MEQSGAAPAAGAEESGTTKPQLNADPRYYQRGWNDVPAEIALDHSKAKNVAKKTRGHHAAAAARASAADPTPALPTPAGPPSGPPTTGAVPPAAAAAAAAEEAATAAAPATADQHSESLAGDVPELLNSVNAILTACTASHPELLNKKTSEEVARKLELLGAALLGKTLSHGAHDTTIELLRAISAKDHAKANELHVKWVAVHPAEVGPWAAAVKRLVHVVAKMAA